MRRHVIILAALALSACTQQAEPREPKVFRICNGWYDLYRDADGRFWLGDGSNWKAVDPKATPDDLCRRY